MKKQKIVVGITGASGSIYAKVLLDELQKLQEQIAQVAVVMSKNAPDVWKYELGNDSYLQYAFQFYERNDFFAPPASGSAGFDTMIVCPCSMGTLGRMANGISDDLITRAADVMLKERKKLILVPRDSPYNLIHLRNMTLLSEAGAIIAPASPSFYSRPNSFEDLAKTIVHRVLDLAELNPATFRWGAD